MFFDTPSRARHRKGGRRWEVSNQHETDNELDMHKDQSSKAITMTKPLVGSAEEEWKRIVKCFDCYVSWRGLPEAVADLIARAKQEGAREEWEACALCAERRAMRKKESTESSEEHRIKIHEAAAIQRAIRARGDA